EAQLPLPAEQQHPAGDAHLVVGLLPRLDAVTPVLDDLGRGVGAVEADGVRIGPGRAERVDLREPALALVERRFGHANQSCVIAPRPLRKYDARASSVTR